MAGFIRLLSTVLSNGLEMLTVGGQENFREAFGLARPRPWEQAKLDGKVTPPRGAPEPGRGSLLLCLIFGGMGHPAAAGLVWQSPWAG